jgi:SAM-dependent methyltransferase
MELSWEAVYRAGPTPFDCAEPLPWVVELVNRGAVRGTVLDAGCGAGHNALFLARRGFPVVGIDVAPTAVRRAREKALDLDVEFAVADVLDLGAHPARFDTVIDIGCLHSLDAADRPRYFAALRAATRAGAVVHLRSFTDRNAPVAGRAIGLSEDDLRTAATGWDITELVAAVDEVSVPERVPVEFWYLSAHRR